MAVDLDLSQVSSLAVGQSAPDSSFHSSSDSWVEVLEAVPFLTILLQSLAAAVLPPLPDAPDTMQAGRGAEEQWSGGAEVQGSRGAGVPGCQAAEEQWSGGAEVQGSRGADVPGCQAAEEQGGAVRGSANSVEPAVGGGSAGGVRVVGPALTPGDFGFRISDFELWNKSEIRNPKSEIQNGQPGTPDPVLRANPERGVAGNPVEIVAKPARPAVAGGLAETTVESVKPPLAGGSAGGVRVVGPALSPEVGQSARPAVGGDSVGGVRVVGPALTSEVGQSARPAVGGDTAEVVRVVGPVLSPEVGQSARPAVGGDTAEVVRVVGPALTPRNFGFWISDFGFVPQFAIRNPKSEIRNGQSGTSEPVLRPNPERGVAGSSVEIVVEPARPAVGGDTAEVVQVVGPALTSGVERSARPAVGGDTAEVVRVVGPALTSGVEQSARPAVGGDTAEVVRVVGPALTPRDFEFRISDLELGNKSDIRNPAFETRNGQPGTSEPVLRPNAEGSVAGDPVRIVVEPARPAVAGGRAETTVEPARPGVGDDSAGAVRVVGPALTPRDFGFRISDCELWNKSEIRNPKSEIRNPKVENRDESEVGSIRPAVKDEGHAERVSRPVGGTLAVAAEASRKMPADVEAAQPGAPAPRPPIVTQVAESVHRAVTAGRTAVRVRLHPRSLGSLDISLSLGEKGLTVQIKTADPAVKGLLEAHLSQLHGALEAQGLQLEGLSVEFSQMSLVYGNLFTGGNPRQRGFLPRRSTPRRSVAKSPEPESGVERMSGAIGSPMVVDYHV